MLLAKKKKRCKYYIRSCYSPYCLTPHFFLIASHFYRLTVHALCGDDEMRELIGGDDVLIHGDQNKASCSANFSLGLFPPARAPGLGDAETRELIGGGGKQNYGEPGNAGDAANFSFALLLHAQVGSNVGGQEKI